MFQDMPYFMENEEWFRFDASVKKYVLTSDAPPKAKESHLKTTAPRCWKRLTLLLEEHSKNAAL